MRFLNPHGLTRRETSLGRGVTTDEFRATYSEAKAICRFDFRNEWNQEQRATVAEGIGPGSGNRVARVSRKARKARVGEKA